MTKKSDDLSRDMNTRSQGPQNEMENTGPSIYGVMFKAFLSVILPASFVIWIVYEGLFDSVLTENGSEHYAERPGMGMKAILPRWIKMPLNSGVNFGYVIMGAYWCAYTSAAFQVKKISAIDAYISYVFNFMAGFYGLIQLLRILTQLHRFAVLDQWFTLPFFMMVFVWGTYLTKSWNFVFVLQCIIFSIASYALTLIADIGFEIALAVHVFIAVTGGLLAYQKYPAKSSQYSFGMALLCCAGFVGLKLLDLDLAKFHPVFTKISGHFLSKICDIFQIYYVNQYFFSLTFYKYDSNCKKKD